MSICIHCLYKWCKILRCIVVKLLQEINLSFILFCFSPLFILTNDYLKNANWKDCFDITLPNNLLLGQWEKQSETINQARHKWKIPRMAQIIFFVFSWYGTQVDWNVEKHCNSSYKISHISFLHHHNFFWRVYGQWPVKLNRSNLKNRMLTLQRVRLCIHAN
jgi:hypothetical protein